MRMPRVAVLALAGISLASLGWAAISNAPGVEEEYLARQEQLSQQCELRRALRDSFAAFLDRIHERLEKGQMHLPEASSQVLTYCRQCYPTYLEHLCYVENGADWNEKIAQNLVRYFQPRSPADADRYHMQLFARLERELHQMLSHTQASGHVATSHEAPLFTFR